MNVLILGLGSIGRRHARTIRTIDPKTCIYALRSGEGSPEAGVTDIRTLDDAPHPLDLAIVATPTYLHLASVRQVASLKPFLFLEKPLALTVADGAEIVQLITDAGIRSYIGCHLRFHPCLRWVRDALHASSRKIQDVHATCRSWLPDWQPGRDYRQSFRADPAQSGGVHLELIHELDYVTWLFGLPKTHNVTLQGASELDIAVPAVAHYDLSYAHFQATIDLSYASHRTERKLSIVLENGRWTVDLLHFTVHDQDGTLLFQSDWTIDDVYKEQMQHVLACAGAGTPSSHPVTDALETLRLALP